MRWILYVDMDAFYVACELRDRPELRGQPVIVGPKPASPDARGVVLSASYEARAFGVRSALPVLRAAELCPGAVWIDPDFEKYERASQQVRSVLREKSPIVVPLSIDEAALAVDAADAAAVERLARDLREALQSRLSLSASIGAAPFRTVAKIASDRSKPGGITVVPPDGVVEFLAPLPVRAVPGVGPKTEAALRERGVERIGDLARLKSAVARRRFGRFADELIALARGQIREPSIEADAAPRQRSVDRTFARDTADPEELARTVSGMAENLARALAQEGLRYQTVTLRVRWSDFSVEQRGRTLSGTHDDALTLREEGARMVRELLRGPSGRGQRRVRTVALVASRLTAKTGRQSRLDAYEPQTPTVK